VITTESAFAQKINNVPLTAGGKVIKILPDDIGATPHQRFVIEVHSGHTILIAHSLLRAYRVPVKIGDRVEVHGTYVWNRYGGLIHNTHHYGQECVGTYCEVHEDGYINFVGIHKNPHQEVVPPHKPKTYTWS